MDFHYIPWAIIVNKKWKKRLMANAKLPKICFLNCSFFLKMIFPSQLEVTQNGSIFLTKLFI